MKNYETLWKSIKLYKNIYKFNKIYEKTMKIYESLWKTQNWDIFLNFHSFS